MRWVLTRSPPATHSSERRLALTYGAPAVGSFISGSGAPNNGMHSTRDAGVVMFQQPGRRAGDAGRRAAFLTTVTITKGVKNGLT